MFRCVVIDLEWFSLSQNALAVIDTRDMEQLAEMVLNGDGQFLVGTKSDQPEIQAFLDNVPVYMVRSIESVWKNARLNHPPFITE